MNDTTVLNLKGFEDCGYLIIDDAFPLEDLSSFKLALHSAIHLILKKYNITTPPTVGLTIEKQCDQGLLLLSHVNPEYPSIVQAIISRSPEYYRLCSSPKLMGIIRKLLSVNESSPIYLTNNGIIFTNPNDDKNQRSSNISIGWHKDTFFTIPNSRFLHVWAPLLHAATNEIGTLRLCPGSHVNGIGKQRIDPNAQYDHRYVMDKSEVDMFSEKSIELALGQALIFDGNLIHSSGRNISNNIRYTLIGLHHNVENNAFHPLGIEYCYENKTPEEYYYEIFEDSNVLPLLKEQARK